MLLSYTKGDFHHVYMATTSHVQVPIASIIEHKQVCPNIFPKLFWDLMGLSIWTSAVYFHALYTSHTVTCKSSSGNSCLTSRITPWLWGALCEISQAHGASWCHSLNHPHYNFCSIFPSETTLPPHPPKKTTHSKKAPKTNNNNNKTKKGKKKTFLWISVLVWLFGAELVTSILLFPGVSLGSTLFLACNPHLSPAKPAVENWGMQYMWGKGLSTGPYIWWWEAEEQCHLSINCHSSRSQDN